MSTDQTPALARATEALAAAQRRTVTPMHALDARTAVSAALHDPDDPDWLMNVIADVPLRQGSIPQCEAVILADAVRAALLGGDS